MGDDVQEYFIDRWLNADPRSLIAFCSNWENIGMAEILPSLTVPFLLYAGQCDQPEHDLAKSCANILQNATFISLPKLDHVGGFSELNIVIPHVIQFLERI